MDLVGIRLTIEHVAKELKAYAQESTSTEARQCAAHLMGVAQEVRALGNGERKKQRGPYAVVRWCCTSSNCIQCLELGRGNRVRVTQLDGLSKKRAEEVCSKWDGYGAEVVRV